jgi:hypothetical protein
VAAEEVEEEFLLLNANEDGVCRDPLLSTLPENDGFEDFPKYEKSCLAGNSNYTRCSCIE